jgi:uncharacterized protein YegP (UPF0339 family)
MPDVVYYKDASDAHLWRYRVVADNHEIVHASHKGWAAIDDARTHLWAEAMAFYFLSPAFNDPTLDKDDGITVSGPDLFFSFRQTPGSSKDLEWWWDLEITQATVIYLSGAHEGFKNQADCLHNAKLVGEILWDDYEEIISDE